MQKLTGSFSRTRIKRLMARATELAGKFFSCEEAERGRVAIHLRFAYGRQVRVR
jgi:hypothetical protein